MAAIETGSVWTVTAITNYGWLKLLSLGAAGMGALLMAIFRPPKTRKEMLYQGAVALGTSLLFGNFIANNLAHVWGFIDLALATPQEYAEYQAAIHGIIGATSWGIFGGLAQLRDRLFVDPVGTVKDVRNL